VPTKEQLERDGWRPASITGGQHLRRVVQMYEELGFETHLEEMTPEECGGCTECYRSAGETIYQVYTRAADSRTRTGTGD